MHFLLVRFFIFQHKRDKKKLLSANARFYKKRRIFYLPSNLIESLLKENTQNFESIHTLQEKLVTIVNNLNATLNKWNDTFHESNLIIDQKLDNICTLIKNNNTTTQQHLPNGNQTNNVSHTKENINQQLYRRRLHYQILQSQDLQECYNDLISQESPYVPAKFKVKSIRTLQLMKFHYTATLLQTI